MSNSHRSPDIRGNDSDVTSDLKQEKDKPWYQGTDTSGVVVPILEQAIENISNGKGTKQDIQELKRVLKIEKSRNWIGYVWGLIGLIQYCMEKENKAEKSFEKAMDKFKPYEDGFWDVSNVYCQVSYSHGIILYFKNRYLESLKSFYQCFNHMDVVYDDVYIGNVYLYIGMCLNNVQRDDESRIFLEHAHVVMTDKSVALERLMVVYSNLGMTDTSKEVFDLILQKYPDYSEMGRVKDFARKTWGISAP